MLEDLRVPKELEDSGSGLPPLIIFTIVSAGDQMGCGSHGAKTTSDITAVGLAIPEDDTMAKHTVVLLLYLGRLADSRSEASHIFRGVYYPMELGLDGDLCWINLAKRIEHIVDKDAKISLYIMLDTSE
jgi:hypothetical protein